MNHTAAVRLHDAEIIIILKYAPVYKPYSMDDSLKVYGALVALTIQGQALYGSQPHYNIDFCHILYIQVLAVYIEL